MAASRVGSVVRGGSGSAGSHATTLPQTPTAGNLLLAAMASTRAGTLTDETLSGWTRLGSGVRTRASVDCLVSLFGKWSVGGESAPAIVHSAAATCSWTTEEWAGLDGNFPAGIPEAATMGDLSSGGTTVFNQDETADSNNEWVFAVLGGRASAGGDILSAWDASDLTASSPTTQSSNTAAVYTAHGSIATAATVKNFTATAKASSQGSATAGLIVVGFALAGGGPPALVLPDVMVGGAEDPVAALSVMAAGARDAAADVGLMSGGARLPLV